jgi:hypothetical protein
MSDRALNIANMPIGSLHAFTNKRMKPARMLISVAPAGSGTSLPTSYQQAPDERSSGVSRFPPFSQRVARATARPTKTPHSFSNGCGDLSNSTEVTPGYAAFNQLSAASKINNGDGRALIFLTQTESHAGKPKY